MITDLASVYVKVLMIAAPILGTPALIGYWSAHRESRTPEQEGRLIKYGAFTLVAIAQAVAYFHFKPTSWGRFGMAWLQAALCLIACWGLYRYTRLGIWGLLLGVLFGFSTLVFLFCVPILPR